MRRFACVILDDKDTIIDRYVLPFVTSVDGLGYSLKLSSVETDVENFITKKIQEKKSIKLAVNHTGDAYLSIKLFNLWLQKYINAVMCLEYTNDRGTGYCEGVISVNSYAEKNEFGYVSQNLTFQPLTPFFVIVANQIKIKTSNAGKSYPYKYPYTYGRSVIENNVIENDYITDIPVTVVISGSISNPQINLRDGKTNEIYNEVRFVNVNLCEGEQIVVNSARKKVWHYFADGQREDFYYKLDGAYDSFLRAAPQTISKISINLAASDTGELIGIRRQYYL